MMMMMRMMMMKMKMLEVMTKMIQKIYCKFWVTVRLHMKMMKILRTSLQYYNFYLNEKKDHIDKLFLC